MGRIAEITEGDLDFMMTYFTDIVADMDEVLFGDDVIMYLDKKMRPCIYCEGTDELPPLEADPGSGPDRSEWGAWCV